MLLSSWVGSLRTHLTAAGWQTSSRRRCGGTTSRMNPALRTAEVEQLESRLLLTVEEPAQLLRDINEFTPPSFASEIVQSGGKVFFTADDGKLGASDGVVGKELFVIEGANPPRLVKDIYPGYYGSGPQNLIDVGGVLFFTADDGEHGRELWMSDGTQDGTRLVTDIFPGTSFFETPNSSDPNDFEVVVTEDGFKLFFSATSDTGSELWMADTNGASQVLDLFPGNDDDGNPNSSLPSDLTFVPFHQVEVDDDPDDEVPPAIVDVPPTLFFSADNGTNGRELWKTVLEGGGTQTSLIKNIFEDLPGETPTSSNPLNLIRFQNEVYFSAKDGTYRDIVDNDGNVIEEDHLDARGIELWKSDGTEDGTVLVEDINHFVSAAGVPNNSSPSNFAVHNGKLYFAATDETFVVGTDDTATGRELWVTDGETTELVRDIRAGATGSSNPTQLVSTDGFLYFKASSSNTIGNELWRTDGTSSGTQLVRDIRVGSNTPFTFARDMTRLGSSLIFAADDGVLGPEVWITDGTLEGTHVLRETQLGRNSATLPESFSMIGDRVYFESAAELWITDGTLDGTQMIDVPTPVTISSGSAGFAFANGSVFFAADDGIHGMELWKTDGSENGTVLLRDIAPSRSSPFEGSSLLVPDSGSPTQLTAVGDRVFFVANHSSELWVSDGTTAGTVAVKDIDPDGDAAPYSLTAFGDQLFFFATVPGLGTELWVSDGTSDGTHIVKDILQIPDFLAFPDELTVAGGKLFFRHDDGEGFELWVSDGTEEGTQKLNLAPDGEVPTGSFPSKFAPVGNRVFFTADDGVHGQELWVSDGTPEGTSMVRDIHIVANEIDFSGARIRPIGVLNGEFYFWAEDQEIGQALWKSDGTLDGTMIVKDIRTDGENEFFGDEGDATSAATVSSKLYFVADDGEHGSEIWVTDGTPEGTQLFKDIFPDFDGSFPRDLTAVGDSLFFTAELASDEPNEEEFFDSLGRQLWVSDGTPGGTQVHTRFDLPSGDSADPRQLATFGGEIYFTVDDGIHGEEVWTTSSRLKADDVLFEILARDIAYRDTFNNRPVDSPADLLQFGDEISLNVLGYGSPFVFTVDLVIHDLTSFDAYGLVGENFAPILAVRGSQELLDFFSDALAEGIGVNQFEAVREEVFAWLDTHTTAEQKVSITGHSLGGALTQLIAANYTAQGGMLDQVVTFNSPAIGAETADLFRPENVERVRHYVTNGDPVSLAGDKFIAGDWVRSDFSDLFLPDNHSLPVVADYVSIDNPATQEFEIRVRPDDITYEADLGLDWLNDPYYYHTDTDYFLWLAGGAILTNSVESLRQYNDVPPALLFRSTTEDLRQRVGEAIAPLQTAIDTIINTLTLTEVRAEVPDISLNLLNLLTINATDLSVTYFGDPGELRLQGQVSLPQLYNTTADFTGENYIALSPDGFELRGEVSAEEIVLVPNAWELKEVHVGLDTVNDPVAITAGGTLQIPTGIDVIAELQFLGTEFNSITLGADGLNKPIGATGLFLQSISGTVDHVAEADPDPVSFGGDVTATGGPEIDISLPSWAGGDFSGSLLSIAVNGEIDAEHLTAAGTLNLIEGLATAGANVELNWTDGFLAANGEFNILNGLIVADAAFRADASLNINSTANATFTIPDPIPIIGGREGLSGTFLLNFTNDSDFSNDFAAAWTGFNLPLIGQRRLGFRVFFDGSFGLIGGQTISQLAALRTASLFAEGSLPEPQANEPEEPPASDDFLIAADTPWALFSAQWDDASPDTRLVLMTPSGQTLTEADIAERTDMAIVEDFNSPTRRVVVVQIPEAGVWNVSVNDDTLLTNLTFTAFAEGGAPFVEIVSATGGFQQTPVTITFNAFDADSNAVVSLFYDTDAEGADGVPIVTGLVEADGEQRFVWNPSGIPVGEYFLYALIDDGDNPPEISYFAGSVDTSAPFPTAIVTTNSLIVAADNEQEPLVRVFTPEGTERFSFFAYDPAFRGGVRVATGDVNGDGMLDIITAPGAGADPHIKVFSGADGSELSSFFAYSPSFQGGVYVATGDVNGDGRDDIITGAGAGSGPNVKVFSGATGSELASFFAYGTGFLGGVRVATGDVNGDGLADIITGSGPGAGPQVKVFDGRTQNTLKSFFAYSTSFRGGVFVAAGDVNGDGWADIVTGADAGGGPHVKVFSGANNATLQSFFAFDPAFQGGVRVAVGDVDADDDLDIITGAGAGGGPHVKVFDGQTLTELRSFFAFDPEFTSGAFVGTFAPPSQRRLNLPSGGGTFDVTVESGNVVVRDAEGNVLTSTPLAGLHELHLVGSDSDDDTFRIDLENLPLDVFVDGGAGGNDSLEIFGGTIDVATHTLENRNDGILQLDGRTIHYTGLEPVDLSDVIVADWVFQMPNRSDRAVLEDAGDPDDGLMQLRSLNGTFESTLFRIPTSSLTINAGGGNDTVTVASEDALWTLGVSLNGETGNDSLTGGGHDDSLNGGGGSDRLSGADGDDELRGGSGRNQLNGGEGDDVVISHSTRRTTQLTNTKLTAEGTDQLKSIEHAELFGSDARNVLDASRFTLGSVTLHGGGGDDMLTGSTSDDDLDGGGGFDIVKQASSENQTASDAELSGEGTDSLASIEGLHLRSTSRAGVQLNATEFSGPVTLFGGRGHDTLAGGTADDFIVGSSGHDAIHGGDGNDRLDGGADNDTVLGGNGNDTIKLHAGSDVALGGDGHDRLYVDSRDTVSTGPDDDTLIGRPRVIDEAFEFDFEALLM